MTTVKDLREYLLQWEDETVVTGELNLGLRDPDGEIMGFCNVYIPINDGKTIYPVIINRVAASDAERRNE